MNSTGSWPTQTMTGHFSPRSNHLSRWMRPCLPGEMYTFMLFSSCTMPRYVPKFTHPSSGSLVTTRQPVPM